MCVCSFGQCICASCYKVWAFRLVCDVMWCACVVLVNVYALKDYNYKVLHMKICSFHLLRVSNVNKMQLVVKKWISSPSMISCHGKFVSKQMPGLLHNIGLIVLRLVSYNLIDSLTDGRKFLPSTIIFHTGSAHAWCLLLVIRLQLHSSYDGWSLHLAMLQATQQILVVLYIVYSF